MPNCDVQGTQFRLSLLPLNAFASGYFVKTQLAVKNEHVSYDGVHGKLRREELEEWIFAMFRLLAGAYAKEYTLSFENAGFAVDLYPYTVDGEAVSREERRQHDCVMAIRLIMRSKDKKQFLGGVYTLLLHKEKIKRFAKALRLEFDTVFARFLRGKGKYTFVGVSPLGYTGCNYWYLDKTGTVACGDYVWVYMGRHNTRQIVYVDSVRRYDDNTAPYDPEWVKCVLKKATADELKRV